MNATLEVLLTRLITTSGEIHVGEQDACYQSSADGILCMCRRLRLE